MNTNLKKTTTTTMETNKHAQTSSSCLIGKGFGGFSQDIRSYFGNQRTVFAYQPQNAGLSHRHLHGMGDKREVKNDQDERRRSLTVTVSVNFATWMIRSLFSLGWGQTRKFKGRGERDKYTLTWSCRSFFMTTTLSATTLSIITILS